ncbi:MAG TPA: protease PrsW [Candidatus Thermoplasmatota archaeon]|nr:protease PrsW [Candidatus Thermoplasmatota archaeon]
MAIGFLPQSSLFIGIIPALALVYLIIRKWTGQFQEKTVFLMFVIGIISGFFSAIIENSLFLQPLLIITLFPLLEQLIKTMILNFPRFHEKQSTVLYGLVLGLGFGSIFPPVSLLLIAESSISSAEVISIFIGSLGLVFLHGASGALIGYGVFARKIPIMFLYSVLILVAANLLKFPNIQWITLVLGILMYWIVMTKVVYPVLKQSIRRKRNASETISNQ